MKQSIITVRAVVANFIQYFNKRKNVPLAYMRVDRCARFWYDLSK
jgi:hypothetical protein